MSNFVSAKITLWCSRVIALAVAVLCVALRWLLGWYESFRPLDVPAETAILAGFYCCVPVVLYALWCVDRLVGNLLKSRVFVTENVRRIRHIHWCCGWVSAVSLVAGCFYQPLLFLAVIMVFLALVVSLVKNVMAAAVELREENDLTV